MIAKIKYTKHELKSQRDDLHRYLRYLPTLELKKRQLHVEVFRVNQALEEKKTEENGLRLKLEAWVRLFAEEIDFSPLLKIQEIQQDTSNIAGVDIPVLKQVVFVRGPLDLHLTPPWVDEGLRVVESLIKLRIEQLILAEQKKRLADELRTTSQRVNLFEKVKIPESMFNIRKIRIFLGDEQTAGVVRAKIAKEKTVEVERSR